MTKNTKGWLRIVEAFVAIILIAGVLIAIYSRTIEKPSRTESIYNMQKTILDEIASDPEKRQYVLENKTGDIENFVKERIPAGFNYSIRICDLEDICGLQEYKEEVYSSERRISSTLKIYSPKKLKIFMWLEK